MRIGEPDVQPGTTSQLSPHHVAQIREQLDRILADPAFSGATRRSRLLRYLVEETLADRPEALKESVVATEVFDRAPDYDPQMDSIVRVEVGRLRTRLAEFYAKSGTGEAVRIEIPRGGYRPSFEFRDAQAEPVGPPPTKSPWKLYAAAALTLIAGLLYWRLRDASPPAPVSIAVLPFINFGGNPSDEYLGDGISEDLTQALAGFNDLRVVARTSAFQYKGKNVDIREIGRNLRAAAVLEGSVARRGDSFHVVAQLIRSSDGYHLWSHTYDTPLAQLPPVETGIAQAAREKLIPSAPSVSPGLSIAGTPEAHDLYMRAVYVFNQRTAPSTREAMDLARQAAQKDPSFAQPYVLLAAGESQLTTLLAEPTRPSAERAWEDIAKALALDPSNSGAHAQKALLAYTNHWDWPQAEREFRLALASGSHGSAENLYGWCLITRGRFDEARRRLQIAAELDPLSLGPQLNQIEELLAERNYPEAKRKVDQILSTAPSNPVALGLAINTAYWQRDCPAGKAASDKLVQLYQSPSARLGSLAIDTVCGREAEAKATAAEIVRQPGKISPYSIAATHALAGNLEGAIAALEQSAELREPRIMLLKYDRVFEPLHQYPRFIALEHKLGLLE